MTYSPTVTAAIEAGFSTMAAVMIDDDAKRERAAQQYLKAVGKAVPAADDGATYYPGGAQIWDE